jgi:hypothetical protein
VRLESIVTQPSNKTVALNVVIHVNLRTLFVVGALSRVLVEGLVTFIEGLQRVKGIVSNVGQKRRLPQCLN